MLFWLAPIKRIGTFVEHETLIHTASRWLTRPRSSIRTAANRVRTLKEPTGVNPAERRRIVQENRSGTASRLVATVRHRWRRGSPGAEECQKQTQFRKSRRPQSPARGSRGRYWLRGAYACPIERAPLRKTATDKPKKYQTKPICKPGQPPIAGVKKEVRSGWGASGTPRAG